jgi:membrane protease YdiL (CAAX protease family)
MDQVEDTGGAKPLWRRIVDYPLVAMLIAIALVLLVSGLAAFIAERTPNVGGFTANMRFGVLGAIFLVLAYELLIRHLGERKRDDYRDPRALRHLLMGLGAGLGVFSIAVAIAAALGVYSISGQGDLTDLLPAFITAALFPAISEELVFRGIMFRWLEEWGGSWVALVLTSALFGAGHLANPHASWIAAVGIAVEAGVMLGAAYMLTRSLWLPMGIHAAWNFAQGEIYDIPVSGTPVHGIVQANLSGPPLLTGAGFGLEASLAAIIPATLFGLWLLWLAIRKGELMAPRWVRRRVSAVPAAA